MAAAYDAAVESALLMTSRVGSSTTRVNGLVNRGPEFDALYLHPLLSTLRSHSKRTVQTEHDACSNTAAKDGAQNLHVDYQRDRRGWTMIGFIHMVDPFRDDNGATRFVPGSHLWSTAPPELLAGSKADYPEQVLRVVRRVR